MKTQLQMFYDADARVRALNRAFMDLVADPVNPLTSDDLRKLILRRPEVYERFAGYIGKLPGDKA